MITIRPAAERGHVNLGWLDSHHSFSFGDYYDPAHMGVSNLRVINEDWIQPDGGFATHGHKDMEIVSVVLAGALEHKDSMGNGSIIRPGDVQHMSAGRGVRHSEYNPSSTEAVHLLQIWLTPNRLGVDPGYAQQHFAEEARHNRLALLVSPDGRDGSIAAHQDALLFGTRLDAGRSLDYRIGADRRGWIQIARGRVLIAGQELSAGDGAGIAAGTDLVIEALADQAEQAELLLFDLP
jgi:redox-sensitive bicupin YhaK (pirin superfamily)